MIKIIPTPKKCEVTEEMCFVPCNIYTSEKNWERYCEIFADMFCRANDVQPEFAQGGIDLIKDDYLKLGSYVLDVKDTVRAYAADDEGILYALASILQLTEYKNDQMEIPVLHIRSSLSGSYLHDRKGQNRVDR